MIVKIDDDFSLKKIMDSGQCFRVAELEDGWFRFVHKGYVLYIRSLEDGKVKEDSLSYRDEESKCIESNCTEGKCDSTIYEVSCSEDVWNSVWCEYFDFDTCYSSVRGRIDKKDCFLAEAAEYSKGIRILRQDPFEMLISFIISQRKSIPSIKSCVEYFCRKFGKKITSEYEDIWLFPTKQDFVLRYEDVVGDILTSENIKSQEVVEQLKCRIMDDLSDCKLGYRDKYVCDAIIEVITGELDLIKLYDYSDMDLFDTLKSVNGVGDKVANCICLFAYHRTNLVPVDVWIKRVFDAKYNGCNPLLIYKESAGIMQQYIFHYVTAKRGL